MTGHSRGRIALATLTALSVARGALFLAPLGALLLAPLRANGADADLKASVAAAARKLAGQVSYTWRTTTESSSGGRGGGGSSTTTGRVEAGGYTWVVSTGSAELEFAIKDGRAAVALDGDWMTLEEASTRVTGEGRGPFGPPRFNPESVTRFKMPLAQVGELLEKAVRFREDSGAMIAELPPELAGELLSSSGRGPGERRGGRGGGGGGGGPPARGVKDPRGSVSFAIKDGTLTQLTLALSGSREFGANEVKVDRTTTTRFFEIGSKKAAVPADARAIVEALIAGKPSPVFVPEPGFRKLFNGRDLTGWAARSGHWSVEDGAIAGRTTKQDPAAGHSLVATTEGLIAGEGGKSLLVDDFELRLSYRIEATGGGSGRAGIRYRGKELPGSVDGHEADFQAGPGGSGGAWNELAIIAQGNRRQHLINGMPAAAASGEAEGTQPDSGVLALEIQSREPMTVQVKDVRLKPLRTPDLQGASNLRAAKDFTIELLYTVPREREGSWVAMCVDPRGRLIVSDQNGGLFRVTVPATSKETIRVERIEVDTGGAHGLLWAFDSLYVVVNERNPRGLYRVRDTDGDDRLDKVELLRELRGGGEHGFHALVPSPDGKALFLVAGNQTQLTRVDSSRAPLHWGEDDLLPRLPTGFMDSSYAPQGWIASTDPDGARWELFAMGLRNPYDIAFNKAGELFTYDADMEWDIGDPWYRPTRVNHVVSGAEFGFRNGNGKWPAFVIDSFGALADVGPGSPTGISFGYGARFPARYQDALFIADWSFGKLRAVHLKPDGATYTGEVEDFVSGQPFPITDFVVNPLDGAMYVAVGGRGAQSALYRIAYRGPDSTAPGAPDARFQDRRDLRRKLEAFHGSQDPAAVETLWPYLGDSDRAIRFAARVALEWQEVSSWRARALGEKEPRKALAALVALARASGRDSIHRKSEEPPPDPALRSELLEALDRIAWTGLSHGDRRDLLRAYWLALARLGKPDDAACARLAARFDALLPLGGNEGGGHRPLGGIEGGGHRPSRSSELSSPLAQLLIHLEAPTAAARVLAALREAPTQEEQIEYAVALRALKTGWTMPLREEYFRWFVKAQAYRGGNTFAGSLRRAREDAVALLSAEEKAALRPILEARSERRSPQEALAARPLVKEWTLEELLPMAERAPQGGYSFERGRRLYGEVACAACHRFANEGGSVGPDLSGVAGRFGLRDLLEAIVNPSKAISDQYQAVVILKKNGQIVAGRIGNLSGSSVSVIENMLDPGAMTGVRRAEILSIEPSPVSPMPEGLLNTLGEDEIRDLLAYLLSRGDPGNAMFR